MISRIKLENWRTHRNSEFNFEKGTNVLVGVMGSGKTSVMDAICYALFGTFPALNARRVSIDEVIMNKPNPMQEAKLTLEFTYADETYSVERKILRKGTNYATLKKDCRLIAGPKTTDVTNAIEKILEINYELFTRAVYSEQNQIDYFMRLSPAQRKEKFDELLGINRYEKVRSSAVSVQNRIKKLAQDKRAWIEQQSSQLDESKITELTQKLTQNQKKIETLKKEKTEKEATAKTLLAELKTLEEQEAKHRALKDKRIQLATSIDSTEKSIKEIQQALEGKTLEELNKKIESIEKETNQLTEKKTAVQKEEETLTQKKNTTLQKIKVNESKISELSELTTRLSKAGAECPVCKSSLAEEKKHSLHKQNQETIEALKKQNLVLAQEAEKTENQIKTLKNTQNQTETQASKNKEQILKLKSLLESANKITEKQALLQKTKAELETTDSQLKSINFDESLLKEKRSLQITAVSRIDSIQKEIESSTQLIAQFRDSIKTIDKTKKQMQELAQQLECLNKNQEALEYFKSALLHTQEELRTTLTDTINSAMEDIWPRLYPYGDYTSAKLQIEKGSYEVMVKERAGTWKKADGLLSGGERSAVAISLRVAVSLVLTQNLSWLILDEPTHNLDTASVEALGIILKQHLPELVGQIFVITHDKQMENAASAGVFLLERNKAEDAPTQVTLEPVKL